MGTSYKINSPQPIAAQRISCILAVKFRGELQFRADGHSCGFQVDADAAVFCIGGHIESQHLHASKNGVDLRRQLWRALPDATVAQLCSRYDADADRIRPNFRNAFGDATLRASRKLRDDIGVQHVEPAHKSISLVGSWVSSTSGN